MGKVIRLQVSAAMVLLNVKDCNQVRRQLFYLPQRLLGIHS